MNKFRKMEDEMKDFFVERDDEIRGLMLALLSREHVFIVGPPGTAKSMMIRTLHENVKDSDYFDYLMTRFTKPEELFGPMKISKLKEDEYERKIQDTLVTSNFAFVDEIWKANSSILNSLLSILQERIFDNGPKKIDVPLETCMSASNELPEEREELGAMWDRFVLKYRVNYIQDEGDLEGMLKNNQAPNLSTTLTLDEIHDAQREVQEIELTDDAYSKIVDVRRNLFNRGIKPSDRRVKDAMKVVKAHAYLYDRAKANLDDLTVLNHILWDSIDDIPKVRETVLEITNPARAEVEEIFDGLMEQWKNYEKADESEKDDFASEATGKMKGAIKEMKQKYQTLKAQERNTEKVEEYIKRGIQLRKRIIQESFEADMDDVDFDI